MTTPYFIGTKLEAFRGRGKGDFYASSDLEDIITVLDGRPTVVEDVADSPSELRRYIGKEVGRMLDNPEFVNALPGHLSGDEISQARVPMILRTLNSLRGLGPRRSAPRRRKTRFLSAVVKLKPAVLADLKAEAASITDSPALPHVGRWCGD